MIINNIKTNNFGVLLLPIGVMIALFSCQEERSMNEATGHESISGSIELPEIVDFNFHIKPIISDRCFKCCGPDKSKIETGLSFVDFESATMALGEEKDHFAIVPNDTDKSELVARIKSDDSSFMMPPPESNLALEEYEKELLIKWIEQGAKYKKHWSLLPIANNILNIKQKEELINNDINNDIDKFILQKNRKFTA